ncbi:MAG: hypothetical protein JXQ71_14805 [Verrucomicrobia bacterium]|nr:hypothetical protein [Verrucomicrobiota bacterium]
MKTTPVPSIQCKKCGTVFPPHPKTKGTWICPHCQAENPNLKRHYRSVADLCILGLVFVLVVLAMRIYQAKVGLADLFMAADAVLLLVTIVCIYKAQAPWANRVIQRLIWIVFGVAFAVNVFVPLLAHGTIDYHRAFSVSARFVVYLVIFGYLFWLQVQARKCAVTTGDTATLSA